MLSYTIIVRCSLQNCACLGLLVKLHDARTGAGRLSPTSTLINVPLVVTFLRLGE